MKGSRDPSRPLPKPGAESVPGRPRDARQRDIQFTPTEEVDQFTERIEGEGAAAEEEKEQEPDVTQNITPEQPIMPKAVEAELAHTDSAIEERIMERIKQTAPVAVVNTETQDLVTQEPPARGEMNSNKKWWIVGGGLVLIAIGVGVGLGVGLSRGGDDDSFTSPPPRFPPDEFDPKASCETDTNGIITCAQEDYPAPNLTTIFLDCPSEQGENVLECVGGCAVVVEAIIDENDRFCTGCLICNEHLSYDCTNIAPDEPCAKTNCQGECANN